MTVCFTCRNHVKRMPDSHFWLFTTESHSWRV